MRTLTQQHESSYPPYPQHTRYTSHIYSATIHIRDLRTALTYTRHVCILPPYTHETYAPHSRTHVTYVFCHHEYTPCCALACVYVSHHLPPYIQRSHIFSATLHTYIMHSANLPTQLTHSATLHTQLTHSATLHTQLTHSATLHTRLCSALWHQQIDMHTLDMHTLTSQHLSI